MNNSQKVREDTRRRILDIIQTAGYRPDPAATNLATKRSYLLGIVTATFTGNAMVHAIEGAQKYAAAHGYHITIAGEELHSRAEPAAVPMLKRQPIEGLLIAYHGSQDDHYQILANIAETIPVVTMGYAFDQRKVVAVRVDSRKGARDAVRHLLDLGHESVAMITGAPRACETEMRIRGYCDAMSDAGRSLDSSLLVEGDWCVESGYLAAKRLMEQGRRLTAVFAHSDRMAMGCIAAFAEQGLRVPEDIAVVGYNDIPESRYYNPPLTTVRYPAFELGQLCAGLLIDLIDGKDTDVGRWLRGERHALETRLVVRRSCGAHLTQTLK